MTVSRYYKPRPLTARQKNAAMEFHNPAGGPLPSNADEEYKYMTSPEVQEQITQDSLAALAACKQQRTATYAPLPRVAELDAMRDDQRQIADPYNFLRAGNAVFTIRSKRTGTRFTFKVRKPGDDTPHFVSVLTGSDNDNDYTFLGSIFADGTYRHGRKSTISQTAPSAVAFAWFWDNIADPALMEKVEVWHEGRCCRCGRRLTVPSSIESGIGPECATKE